MSKGLAIIALLLLEPPTLPPAVLPAGAVLMREHLAVGSADRTGNWRYRFDVDGCWHIAHNTWLRVTDADLVHDDDPRLHFNGDYSDAWFCLAEEQLARLDTALRESRFTAAPLPARGEVERWVASVDGRVQVAVYRAGREPRGLRPLLSLLDAFAEERVWGRSPEWLVSDPGSWVVEPE